MDFSVIGDLWNYCGMIFKIGQVLRNHLVQGLHFLQVNKVQKDFCHLPKAIMAI